MDEIKIKSVLLEQRELFLKKDFGVQREKIQDLENYLKSNLAIVITGIRRCGKSTFLRQISKRFFFDTDFYYINFEDERLIDFKAKDFNKLFEILIELFGEKKVFLIDEIQNIPSWEIFVRRMIDENYKFFITGSNAELLSKELGSRLTGRHIELQLFPFSFTEYLKFKNIEFNFAHPLTTHKKTQMTNEYLAYMKEGGIPASLKIKDFNFNDTLYENIIYRDIISRYKIESESIIKALSHYLVNNISSQIAFNKIKQYLHVGNVTTIKNYISYLENAWLYFTVNIFDASIKRQQIAPKKIYSIDTGLIRNIGFLFSNKYGQAFENNVFLHLKRKFKEIFYYKSKNNLEVDFYIPTKKLLIQASYDISNSKTKEREVSALHESMKELNLNQSYILTLKDEEIIKQNSRKIYVLPIYRF